MEGLSLTLYLDKEGGNSKSMIQKTLTMTKICNFADQNKIILPLISVDENNKNMEKLEIFKQVGRNIRQIRLSKGLSQVNLIGRIEGNIDTTNISRIEQGRTNPTLLTLYRIAQALEVSLLDLVAIDQTKQSSNMNLWHMQLHPFRATV